jgi:hypothetical protein
MDYYRKYLKYKQKYLELVGGGWRSGLTPEQIATIETATKNKGYDNAEKSKIRNQMAAKYKEEMKAAKREEKKNAQRGEANGKPGGPSGRAYCDPAGGCGADSPGVESPRGVGAATPAEINRNLAILGLTRATATGDTIKKAYHRLALRYHPDKSPSSSESKESLANAEEFKKVGNAYAFLVELPEYA